MTLPEDPLPPTPNALSGRTRPPSVARAEPPAARRPPQAAPTRPAAAAPGVPVGPLGRVLHLRGKQLMATAAAHATGAALADDANAALLLRRTAFLEFTGRGQDRLGLTTNGRDALLAWACQHRLGQRRASLAAVCSRREAAIATLLQQRTAANADTAHRRLTLRPEWHLLVGASDRQGPYEIGLALHGTYGWPLLPGSTIKGAARAWASGTDVDASTIARVFGPAPLSESTGQGSVTWFDSLPDRDGVNVVLDGQTPHQQPYYAGHQPPAEWHNPVPSLFLAIDGGAFVLDLIGPQADVDLAATWVSEAADELGIGAKTAAGYGYLTVTEAPR